MYRKDRLVPCYQEHWLLVGAVQAAADGLGLLVVHNVSGARWGAHDGYHRYVVLRRGSRQDPLRSWAVTSRHCVTYTEARFSRCFLPSKRGERAALVELLGRLQEYRRDGLS